jgi:hypothetical protein
MRSAAGLRCANMLESEMRMEVWNRAQQQQPAGTPFSATIPVSLWPRKIRKPLHSRNGLPAAFEREGACKGAATAANSLPFRSPFASPGGAPNHRRFVGRDEMCPPEAEVAGRQWWWSSPVAKLACRCVSFLFCPPQVRYCVAVACYWALCILTTLHYMLADRDTGITVLL